MTSFLKKPQAYNQAYPKQKQQKNLLTDYNLAMATMANCNRERIGGVSAISLCSGQ
jgi:hypothetical protein